MTNYIPTEDISEDSMVTLLVGANGFAYIGQNIHISSVGGDAIFTDENVTVQVDGVAEGGFGLFTNSDNVSFIIGETGLVTGHASRAINLSGNNGYVENAGEVFGLATAVLLDGLNEELRNSGKIVTVGNSRNTLNSAVNLDGHDGGHQLVVNSGLIDGGTLAQVAIWSAGGASADTIINTGTIKGLVSLDLGNDFLDTSRGTLIGTIDMGAGNDAVHGSAAADVVLGGAGNDQLSGNASNDLLRGDAGADLLTGGAGTDRFVFRGGDTGITAATEDRITDFTHAQHDLVDLRSIDANVAAMGDQGFSFIGTKAFTHHAGQLHYALSAGHLIVSGDVNGDAKADFAIVIDHVTTITAADFLL